MFTVRSLPDDVFPFRIDAMRERLISLAAVISGRMVDRRHWRMSATQINEASVRCLTYYPGDNLSSVSPANAFATPSASQLSFLLRSVSERIMLAKPQPHSMGGASPTQPQAHGG